MAAGDIVTIGPVAMPAPDADSVLSGTGAASDMHAALYGNVVVADDITAIPVGSGQVFFVVIKAA